MANGQPMPVVGFLNSGSAAEFADFVTAFRRGLSETGYDEGRNVRVEYHWADGRYDRLPDLAGELVRRPVDVIAATGGIVSARAAQAATKTIPILFISGVDPIKAQLVDDLKHPSGNATGVNVRTTELLPERLKQLKVMVPDAKKIAVLVNPRNFVAAMETTEAKSANLIVLTATNAAELKAAFTSAAEQGAGAILISADPFFTSQRRSIIELAKEHAMPAAYPWSECATAGGLMSFGPSLPEAYQKIGAYAGEVLKRVGTAVPSARSAAVGLPVITLDNPEMFINSGAAMQCKLAVAEGLRPLARLIT
jgi:putative ABC transport system substrate-binding protein